MFLFFFHFEAALENNKGLEAPPRSLGAETSVAIICGFYSGASRWRALLLL